MTILLLILATLCMSFKRLLFTNCMLIAAVVIFAQSVSIKKHDFVYKSVDEHKIQATIYSPDSEEKLPLVIYFHGGGFMFGNREQGLETVLKEKLLANNIALISSDYRLAPETKLKEILKDASDIITWVKHNGQEIYNIDINKIAVVGGSAGGYLALSTGFNPTSAPNTIIAISPPTGFSMDGIKTGDLTLLNNILKDSIVSYGDYDQRVKLWRYLGKNNLALYEIFGFDPIKEPQKLEDYTLTNNITTSYPPTLIIHANNDRLVKADDIKSFFRFLQNKGIESELHLVESGHSSDLINKNPEVTDKITTFLNKQFNK